MGLLDKMRKKMEEQAKEVVQEVVEPKCNAKPLPGFQLYFAGSQSKTAEAYLLKAGANRLSSQLLDRGVVQHWINCRSEGLTTGLLFIDSGAFTAHTQNAPLDVDEYIEYLNANDEELHIFAQVDKIPGVFRQPKSKEDLLAAPQQSWDNYLYMRSKLKSPKKLLPIFHQGEEYKWLENILEWTDEKGEHIPYIGISPANDKPIKEKEKFIDKCFKIIASSSNPNVCTHAFGMTTLRVLEAYPFTSADSTSWIMTGANGGIMTKYGIVTVSSARLNAPEHIRKMPKDAQQEIQKYIESHGYTMESIAEDYKQRMLFNIQYLLNWATNYKYRPSLVRRKYLF